MIASVAAESIFAVLVTPVLLAFQTQAVLAVVGRTAVGWGSQGRGDTATAVTEALNAHAGHTLGGTIGSAIAYMLDPHLFSGSCPAWRGSPCRFRCPSAAVEPPRVAWPDDGACS